MRTRLRRLALIVGVLAALGTLGTATPVLAHHSFSAEFDITKPVNIKGTVTELQWRNPHIWFYVDVKNPDGTVTNWGFSGGPPGLLLRVGVHKEALKPGTIVIVSGYRAKDGSNNASAGVVTFEDGRNVFAGSQQDVAPPKR